MAVLNYKDTAPLPSVVQSALRDGVKESYAQNTVSKAAGDNDGSSYLLFGRMSNSTVFEKLGLEVDAMAGFTSASIGIADSETGAILSANCFMNATDLHNGSTKTSPIDGLSALTHENTLLTLWEHLGLTRDTAKGHYDIVLIGNTVGGAAGSITARAGLIPPG